MSDTANVTPSNALARRDNKPLHPSKIPIDTLQSNAEAALVSLATLLDDSGIPDQIRRKVERIVTRLNPNREGFETDSTGVWKIPSILVTQLTTMHKSKPDNAKPGDIFTTSGLLIGRPFKFYTLYMFEQNLMFEQGESKVKCASPDAKLGSPFGICEKCQFLPINKQKGQWASRKKTDCANMLTALVIDASFNDMYLVSFSKTSRQAGSAFHDILKDSDHVFDREFQLETELKTNESGRFYVLKATPTGVLLNAERMKDGHRDDPASANEKVASCLVGLYKAYREVQLHKHYNGAAGGAATAERMEESFNPDLLKGNATGDEPDFNAADAAKVSSQPM